MVVENNQIRLSKVRGYNNKYNIPKKIMKIPIKFFFFVQNFIHVILTKKMFSCKFLSACFEVSHVELKKPLRAMQPLVYN